MHTRACLVLVLVLGGCSGEEPSWQEGPIGEISEGLSVGGAGGCSTFIVDGLSKQLIAEQNCIRANALVSFSGKKGITIGSNVYPYLEPKAATGLEAAASASGLSINSAFRTIAQQYLLYRWYQNGQCGISLAAVPGNSNHETGIAVDVGNYSSEISNMANHGWTHSYPSSDPVHFDYTAGGTIDLRSESVLAFQKLWNLNNPGAKIAEDGAYGPMTASKIAASPATGFAKGSTCMPQTTPNTPPSNEWAATIGEQSMPQALGAGEIQPAYVEFKNTGTSAWEPGKTFLGTTDPQDRESALSAPDWIAANRPATVDAETKPGETGRFTFSLRGPVVTSAQALTEHFGLVEEGVAWFPAAASLTVDVMVSPAAVPSGDPGDSTEGGVTPTAPGSMGAHGGCSLGGDGAGANATGVALLLVAMTLFVRRRASYPQAGCRASAESSSFSSSRSRS
ncbi:MAG TPA: M15 family metallopeptidase [Polyangia bacterium]